MLAGAVVAVGLQRPLVIVPVAILSHFILDILPHFGVHKHDPIKRNKHPLFQFILIIDVTLAAAMLWFLPAILEGAVSRWVLLIGMVFAFLPDVTWAYRFLRELGARRSLPYPQSWLTRFHDKIQWGERTWGVFVEILFFGVMGVTLGILAI